MNVALRSSINVVSLCTGGGGLDLGFELAIPCARSVVLVEREAFAISNLVSAMQQGIMAEAPLWSDVTTFNGRPWRGLVDGLIGGIPCQPHSVAGKRLGEDDERDLWSDARRIIVQSGAWFVLIENVRGMLTSGGAERVWRDLHRLGFTVEGGLFTASEVGASHERERIFILAVADARCPEWWSQSGVGSVPDWSDARWTESPDWIREPSGELAHAGRECDERWRGSGDLLHATSPIESQGDKRQWDGHACKGGRNNAEPRDRRNSGICGGTNVGAPPRERGRSISIQPRRQDEAGPYAFGASLFPPGPSDLRSWANILASSQELEPAFRRVADGLASRLDIARVERLRMLGNGVVPLQAAYAIRTLAARLADRGSPHAAKLFALTSRQGDR